MNDRAQQDGGGGGRQSRGSEADQRVEPVRSRWTPKPEQILILESIFNSGMVNPPKDETVRIRKLLEKFGSVGDANVFYWFQNRRSRSRRRQRQIQASLENGEQSRDGSGNHQYESNTAPGSLSYAMNAGSGLVGSGSSSSSSGGGNEGDHNHNHQYYNSYSGHGTGLQELHGNSYFGHSDGSGLHFQSGMMTVFINGVATEVGRGPLDTKTMFGDFVLFHSSGVPVQVNEYGFLVHSLHHGESYFLVPRQS